MEEMEGTMKDVFSPQSLNTWTVDVHGYLDLEATDEDSSEGEVRDAYDEELGAEDEQKWLPRLLHPKTIGVQQKDWDIPHPMDPEVWW